MERQFFTDFVRCDGRNAEDLLMQLQKKYPASAFLNMFFLKGTSSGRQRAKRGKFLLTISDKQRFDALSLDVAPAVAPKEKPQISLHEAKKSENHELNPIFVKHPAPDHKDRQVLIDNLIEKFSKDAPKIIYSPETHDADADYGLESSIEDRSIVSPSLAEIYVQQGYVDRAIQMYEILKLHFPEKNSIFAARIEELKIRLDN